MIIACSCHYPDSTVTLVHREVTRVNPILSTSSFLARKVLLRCVCVRSFVIRCAVVKQETHFSLLWESGRIILSLFWKLYRVFNSIQSFTVSSICVRWWCSQIVEFFKPKHISHLCRLVAKGAHVCVGASGCVPFSKYPILFCIQLLWLPFPSLVSRYVTVHWFVLWKRWVTLYGVYVNPNKRLRRPFLPVVHSYPTNLCYL